MAMRRMMMWVLAPCIVVDRGQRFGPLKRAISLPSIPT